MRAATSVYRGEGAAAAPVGNKAAYRERSEAVAGDVRVAKPGGEDKSRGREELLCGAFQQRRERRAGGVSL